MVGVIIFIIIIIIVASMIASMAANKIDSGASDKDWKPDPGKPWKKQQHERDHPLAANSELDKDKETDSEEISSIRKQLRTVRGSLRGNLDRYNSKSYGKDEMHRKSMVEYGRMIEADCSRINELEKRLKNEGLNREPH